MSLTQEGESDKNLLKYSGLYVIFRGINECSSKFEKERVFYIL